VFLFLAAFGRGLFTALPSYPVLQPVTLVGEGIYLTAQEWRLSQPLVLFSICDVLMRAVSGFSNDAMMNGFERIYSRRKLCWLQSAWRDTGSARKPQDGRFAA
jgi:hypothetical protein